MSWTAPMTAVNNVAFTAALFNTHVRDNLLETLPGKATTAGSILVTAASHSVAERAVTYTRIETSETTSSAAYVDLTTPGPAVTVTTGAQALVGISYEGGSANANVNSFASYAVSGATTKAVADEWSLCFGGLAAGKFTHSGRLHLCTGLTPGSNTFTMKYKAGSAGVVSTFYRRAILVVAL